MQMGAMEESRYQSATLLNINTAEGMAFTNDEFQDAVTQANIEFKKKIMEKVKWLKIKDTESLSQHVSQNLLVNNCIFAG